MPHGADSTEDYPAGFFARAELGAQIKKDMSGVHEDSISKPQIDGVADHTVTTQGEFDDLESNVSAGESISLGGNDFTVNAELVLPEGTSLHGGGATLTAADGLDDTMVRTQTGCSVYDITLDGNHENQTEGGCSTIVSGSTDVTYDGAIAKNGYRTCFGCRQVSDVQYVGCVAEAAGDDNIAIGPGAERINLTGVISRNSRGDISTLSSGIEVDDGAQQIVISGAITHDNFGSGIDIHDHDDEPGSTSVTVTGHLSVNDDRGVHLRSTSGSNSETEILDYSDFKIHGSTSPPIQVSGTASHATFANGAILNPDVSRGVYFSGSGTDLVCESVRVFEGPDSPDNFRAFAAEGTTDATFRDCVADGCDIGFRQNDSSTPRVIDCVVDGARSAGCIRVTEVRGGEFRDCSQAISNGVEVINATIESADNQGFTAAEDNARVLGCTFSDCSEAVRVIDQVGVEVRDCRLENNGYGVRTTGSSDGTRVEHCIFDGNTTDFAFSGDGTLRWNRGHETEADGTATLPSGSTTVSVTHGLDETPDASDILVTPIDGWVGSAASQFEVPSANIGGSAFDIVADADPTQDVTFAWSAYLYR